MKTENQTRNYRTFPAPQVLDLDQLRVRGRGPLQLHHDAVRGEAHQAGRDISQLPPVIDFHPGPVINSVKLDVASVSNRVHDNSSKFPEQVFNLKRKIEAQ